MEISIVTPVYNAAEYLLQAIESVKRQGFTDYEWIICDDGSTDGSSEILEQAASENEHIRLITQPNGGVSKARNNCLRHVSGKYLMFLDSDDVFGDDCLQILYNQMESQQADLCIYGWYIHKGDELYSYFFEKRETECSAEDRYQMILTDPFLCGGGYPWNKIWRTSAIEKNGQIPYFREDLKHYEDKLWTLERLDDMKNPRVIYYNEPLYHYYMRSESLSHSMSADGFMKLAENTIDSLDAITEYINKSHPDAVATAITLRNSKLQEIISVLREAGISI
ncbi:MAG: glycosyltransferase [Lachnospiraceae bacterium]|nr:glycosyltransferase [Lachnospiraceae bacterium]